MRPGSRLGGFTFPEALVTLGLTLLFAGLATGLYFQARALVDRLDRQNRALLELTSLATVLPRLCAQVLPPEWLSEDQVFRETGASLEARWPEGTLVRTVRFSTEGGVLTASSGAWSGRWPSLEASSFGWWKVSGRIVGLEVRWTDAGVARTLRLPWGGRTL